ncbi:MAG TPA: biopolymer transporter ExbD [Candidatus Hydrogenedentes bacterium]|jgi:biopolymer transport protein ExbD|nr:biopolymer transporter ExbD [Candidatus Hydrogenedentota bacterium]HPJ99839.1 biopolymer transporter ExbD [Candidatus Hydrogenedentota bacterium]
MKFGNRASEELEGMQLAPLIDIVFLTLVFFMTTTVFTSMESELDIQLPTASQAKMDERSQGEIYINLTSDGKVIVNDRELTLEQLQGVLNRVAELFPGGSVIIRGDRNAVLGRAIAILNCCKNADIDNVSFAALQDEPAGAT